MNDTVRIRRRIEETNPGNITGKRGGKRSDVCLGAFREHSCSGKIFDQVDAVFFLKPLVSPDDLRECEETKLIRILVQCGFVDASQIRCGIKEEISQHYRSESLKGLGKLCVGIGGYCEFLDFGGDCGINCSAGFSTFF